MLANAVDFTAGSRMGLVDPESGILEIGESITLNTRIATDAFLADQHTVNLVIENNDPLNDSLIVPISFNIEPSTITVDPTAFDLGSLVHGENVTSTFTLGNSGGMLLEWNMGNSGGSDFRITVQDGSWQSEVSWILRNLESGQDIISGEHLFIMKMM